MHAAKLVTGGPANVSSGRHDVNQIRTKYLFQGRGLDELI
jgi:hypothetical protein